MNRVLIVSHYFWPENFRINEIVENSTEIIEILNNGKVIFNKSEPNKEPCGMYYIKSGDFNVDVINCENEATVRIN